MSAMIKSKIMEMIMHFLDFFCKLFAVVRASVPDCTWSTAFVTCTRLRNLYQLSLILIFLIVASSVLRFLTTVRAKQV